MDFAVRNRCAVILKGNFRKIVSFKKTSTNNESDTDFKPHFLGGERDLYVQRHDEREVNTAHFLFDEKQFNYISEKAGKCLIGKETNATALEI